MAIFPVLRSLTLENYGLVPESNSKPFLIEFPNGPNAIAGVNGSGKTTLIMLLLRCLTGPYNLPTATGGVSLGQVRPRPVEMNAREKQFFAVRVSDAAEAAQATLVAAFGETVVEIRRNLRDLSIVSLAVGASQIAPDAPAKRREELFQSEIVRLMKVASFFDFLIVVHFLIFMLEDRRALLWDPTAQRQAFRVLLLPSELATEYAEAQQALISIDSSVRNLSAVLSRQRRGRAGLRGRRRSVSSGEAAKRRLITRVELVRKKLQLVTEMRLGADEERRSARLSKLRSEAVLESLTRQLEHLKIRALDRLLGSSTGNARYVLGYLLSEKGCPVCGTNPSPAAGTLERRVRDELCPLCGSHPKAFASAGLTASQRAQVPRIEGEIKKAEAQVTEAADGIAKAQMRFERAEKKYSALDAQRVKLEAQLVEVSSRIPPARAGATSDSVVELGRLLAVEREKRSRAESRFRKAVAESVKSVQAAQIEIATAFRRYLRFFLKEKATLLYQTLPAKVGQSGQAFGFPTFALTMSGGPISGETVRTGPESVSQSQAEFIDLAFRMALITVTGRAGGATLVVDSPEAALDFLFAERAGRQLAAFAAAHPANRVIISSYLPSRSLLRGFFSGVPSAGERGRRILDLIRHAAPNAATRADRARYEGFLGEVIQGEAADA